MPNSPVSTDHYEHDTGSPYLARASTIVLPEPALYLVNGRYYVGQALSVDFFGFGAQSSNSQNLAVFDDALLELAKQNSESCGSSIISGWDCFRSSSASPYLRRSR